MKKSVKITIIAAIAIVVGASILAVVVHLRLSAIEGNEENRQESTSEKIKEAVDVLTNPGSKQNETSESEESESAEQREKEGH